MSLNPSDLINAIENTFGQAWQASTGSRLPQAGADDRRLLFAGVARGPLHFIGILHEEVLIEIISRQAGQNAEAHTVVGAKFDIGEA